MTALLISRYHLIRSRLHDYAPEYRKMLIWFVVLCLAGSMVGCAAVQQASPYVAQTGYIEPVRFSVVMSGMREAVMGNVQSLIMYNEANGQVLFAWPRAGGWAWTVLDSRASSAAMAIRQIGGAGNLMSCADFSCLTKGAETIGYRQVTAADLLKLAPAFCQSVLQQTVSFAGGAMTSMFVVPAGIFPDSPWAVTEQ
jgi:hypothetical protein